MPRQLRLREARLLSKTKQWETGIMKRTLAIVGVIALLSATGAMAQMRPGARAVLQACKPDIARFCSQVPPGQGRIKACMKEHLPELSEPCKEGLFQAWLHQ
jgi:Cysteine rich repeat